MRALVWHGTADIRCDTVPDPKIEDDRDAIIKVTACAICGSDLHLYDHFMPGMEKGDVMGHEFMGEVVEVGPGAAKTLKVGDRVVVPFPIACGACLACQREQYSLCENSNPNAAMAEKVHLPVKGIIENMSWFTGDDGTRYELFGSGGGQELADELGVPLLGQLPLVPALREGGDSGLPVVLGHPDSAGAVALRGVARQLSQRARGLAGRSLGLTPAGR